MFCKKNFLARTYTLLRWLLYFTDIATITQCLVNAWKFNRICGLFVFIFRMQFVRLPHLIYASRCACYVYGACKNMIENTRATKRRIKHHVHYT